MGEMYTDAFVERLRTGSQSIVAQWGLSDDTKVSLLNISENATFRADDPHAARPIIIRVHRPHYHSRDEIVSELEWIDALRDAHIAPIPAALTLEGGGRIASITVDGEERDVVAFEFADGQEPAADENLVGGFALLGKISAQLHAHARSWQRPETFQRKIWNFDTTVGASPHWGNWRDGLGLTPQGRAVLERLAQTLERRLLQFGNTPDKFGLIHADLRLANLLVQDEKITLIDFDDCGFGWFAFDFAASISFIETDPIVPALQAAWVEGYRSVSPLSEEAEAELQTFVLLRRLQLTAWIASHSETPTAQEMGTEFTDGTVMLAENYLTQFA